MKEFEQHGRFTEVASGDLDNADLQRLFGAANMELALLTASCTAALAGVPLALALGLDAGAVDQLDQRAFRAMLRCGHG